MHTVPFFPAMSWLILLLLSPLGCALPGQVSIPRGSIEKKLEERESVVSKPPESGRETWTQRELMEEVLRRHPELRAQLQRAKAKFVSVSAVEGLPPPMAMAQLWQAPLRPPFLYGSGTMLMLEVQQSFPSSKLRSAEAQSMLEESRAMSAEIAIRERELIAQVGMLVIDLQEARARVQLLERYRKLLEEVGAAVQASQSTSAGSLLALSRTEREIASQISEEDAARGQERQAQTSLNLLLGRPPDAPLEVVRESATVDNLQLSNLLERARSQNPEILASSILTQRDTARAEAAEQMSGAPMYTVGINYGWMGPMDPWNHTWGASFSMTLPWLSKGLAAQHRASLHEREASRLDTAATQLRVEQAVASAHARWVALRHRIETLQLRLLPASRRSMEAARTGYITGGVEAIQWIESARDLREVELMLVSARSDLERAFFTLELATGSSLQAADGASANQETP